MTELELLAAIETASVEHDRWLASIGMSDVTATNPKPHPFAGLGAPASDIAEALAYGLTRRQWWVDQMVAAGFTSFARVSWNTRERLINEWSATGPTASFSDVGKVVHRLRRAEAAGLVSRSNPGGGHAYWTLTELGDAELRYELVEGAVA